MSIGEAVDLFKKKNRGLVVTARGSYDSNYYVVCAVENPKEVDRTNPFYFINKSDGSIFRFGDPESRGKVSLDVMDIVSKLKPLEF